MTQTDILHPNNYKFPSRSMSRIKRRTISDLLQGWIGARVGQHMRKVVRAERDAGGVRRTVHQHRSLARRASLASSTRHKPPSQKEQTICDAARSLWRMLYNRRPRARASGRGRLRISAAGRGRTQECGSASKHNVFRTHKASSSFLSLYLRFSESEKDFRWLAVCFRRFSPPAFRLPHAALRGTPRDPPAPQCK
jgi:hypothetical protein